MATKPRGGGLKDLVARPLRKDSFFAASLTMAFLHRKSVSGGRGNGVRVRLISTTIIQKDDYKRMFLLQ